MLCLFSSGRVEIPHPILRNSAEREGGAFLNYLKRRAGLRKRADHMPRMSPQIYVGLRTASLPARGPRLHRPRAGLSAGLAQNVFDVLVDGPCRAAEDDCDFAVPLSFLEPLHHFHFPYREAQCSRVPSLRYRPLRIPNHSMRHAQMAARKREHRLRSRSNRAVGIDRQRIDPPRTREQHVYLMFDSVRTSSMN